MLTTTTVFAKSGAVRGDWFLVDASGKTWAGSLRRSRIA